MSLQTVRIKDKILIRIEQLKTSLVNPEMDEHKTTLARGEIAGLAKAVRIIDEMAPGES